MAPRLKERYREEVAPALMKAFGYRNIMQVPRLEKIVVNMGLGEAVSNASALDHGVAELSA
ncbi:MAG: 50S ribosomal protein L5, partial [Nitrospinota bacterium]